MEQRMRSDSERARTLCDEVNALFEGKTNRRLGHSKALDILARCDGYANHHVAAAMRKSAAETDVGRQGTEVAGTKQTPSTDVPGRVTAADYASMGERLRTFELSTDQPISAQRKVYERTCRLRARLLSRVLILRVSATDASRNLRTLLEDVIAADGGEHEIFRSLATSHRDDETLQDAVRQLDEESRLALRNARLEMPGGATTEGSAATRFDRLLAGVLQQRLRECSIVPAKMLEGADVPTVGEEVARRMIDDGKSLEANLRRNVLHGNWRMTQIIETEQMVEMPPARTTREAMEALHGAGLPMGVIEAAWSTHDGLSMQALHDMAVVDYLLFTATQPDNAVPIAPTWTGYEADYGHGTFAMRYRNG